MYNRFILNDKLPFELTLKEDDKNDMLPKASFVSEICHLNYHGSKIYTCALSFAKESAAQEHRGFLHVYFCLKNFAKKNNSKEFDWGDENQHKYSIIYDHRISEIQIVETNHIKDVGQIYFTSREVAQKAIEVIGEENIKKYLFDIKEKEED